MIIAFTMCFEIPRKKKKSKYRQVHDQLPISFFIEVRVHETKRICNLLRRFLNREIFFIRSTMTTW